MRYDSTMRAKSLFHALRALGLASVAALLVTAPAQAAGHFGGGGGGGYHGGGYHGGGGYGHGYGYGHYGYGHGGYGWRGYGWHGGWGWGGWGWWGWPGYGLFLATLPLYYSTLWWDGVPYYYAYDNYYIWSPEAGGYVAVTPPAGMVAGSGGNAPPAGAAPPGSGPPMAAGNGELYAYPRNG